MKHSLTQKIGILAPIMLMMASMMSLPTGVMADQNYVGILAGKSEVDIEVKSLNGAAYDKTSIASSIFMGREFDDGYSVELFYTNLGSTKLQGAAGSSYIYSGETITLDSALSANLRVRTYGVAEKYYVDLREPTRMSMKLGMHKWSAKMAARIPGASTRVKFDGTDAMAGIGVEHAAGENTALMAGFDSYGTDGETISLAYLGLRFNFD
ncbi:MAG: outer membrane beta-barrel protein [Candidatus Puniceispirillaceae bacterium]